MRARLLILKSKFSFINIKYLLLIKNNYFMKSKILLMIVVATLFSVNGYSQRLSNDTLQHSMNIPGIPDDATVTVDGKSDESFWGEIPFQTCTRDITNAWEIIGLDSVRSSATMHVKFKLAYDATSLYFFADVTDDALISWSQVKDQTFANNDGTTGITQPYWCDNIELYTLFAPVGTVEGPWSLTYASQLRMWPDLNPTSFSDKITGGGWSSSIENPGAKGYVTSTVKTDNGYTFEARIPFAVILPPLDVTDAVQPVVGNTIQFDVNPADRDVLDIGTTQAERAGRERTTIHSWNSRWNRDWGFTDYYGTATFGEKLPSSSSVPNITVPGVPDDETVTIDGKADEAFWSKVTETSIAKDITNAWEIEGVLPLVSSADFGMKFKLAYDENNLYFFADVTDESLISWSQVKDQKYTNGDGTTGVTQPYWCDNIELFTLFAPTGTVEGPWSLTYASQLRMWPDLNPTSFGDKITGGGWSSSIENPGAKGYVTSTVKTDKGYTFEARIPLEVILPPLDVTDAVQPVVGNTIQFDVNPADRDILDLGTTEAERAGRERELIAGWAADWNRNWGFTDYYGTATFGAKIITSGIGTNAISDLVVLYSSANKEITIRSANVVSATLYNIAGQAMTTRLENGKMPVSDMKAGIYILSAKDAFGNRVGTKKIAIF